MENRGPKYQEAFLRLPEEDQQLPILSWSQLQTLLNCGFRFHMGYRLGYTEIEKSRPLEIGSLTHEGLADFYELKKTQGISGETYRDEYLFPLVTGWLQSQDHLKITYASIASWVLHRYLGECDFYDLGHEILEVEYYFVSKLYSKSGRPFLFQGHVDLITRDARGMIHVWDHKTGGKFWSDTSAMMDGQTTAYLLALANMPSPIQAQGLVINFLKSYDFKKKEQVKQADLFKRLKTLKSTDELENISNNLLIAADVWLDALDLEKPLIRKLNKDCNMCPFTGPCSDDLKGIPVDLSLHALKMKREYQAMPTNNLILEMDDES